MIILCAKMCCCAGVLGTPFKISGPVKMSSPIKGNSIPRQPKEKHKKDSWMSPIRYDCEDEKNQEVTADKPSKKQNEYEYNYIMLLLRGTFLCCNMNTYESRFTLWSRCVLHFSFFPPKSDDSFFESLSSKSVLTKMSTQKKAVATR